MDGDCQHIGWDAADDCLSWNESDDRLSDIHAVVYRHHDVPLEHRGGDWHIGFDSRLRERQSKHSIKHANIDKLLLGWD